MTERIDRGVRRMRREGGVDVVVDAVVVVGRGIVCEEKSELGVKDERQAVVITSQLD